MANICLVAVFGTGLLCAGEAKQTVTDTGCQVFGPDIARLGTLTEPEIAALTRQRKEAIVSLKRNKKRICK